MQSARRYRVILSFVFSRFITDKRIKFNNKNYDILRYDFKIRMNGKVMPVKPAVSGNYGI